MARTRKWDVRTDRGNTSNRRGHKNLWWWGWGGTVSSLVGDREPDKLRIFVNYALKTPEYECLSNFNRITYCCHFSAYARGFVLFRTYESRSGDAEFGR